MCPMLEMKREKRTGGSEMCLAGSGQEASSEFNVGAGTWGLEKRGPAEARCGVVPEGSEPGWLDVLVDG